MLLFAPASLTESTGHAQKEREEEGTDDDDEIHFLRHRVFHRVAKSTQHEPKGVRLKVAVVAVVASISFTLNKCGSPPKKCLLWDSFSYNVQF